MTQRFKMIAALAACFGVLCAATPKAESFKDRADAFNKIQKEHKKDLFEALNKSLKDGDELYGKKDGKKDASSYLVCYTKEKADYKVAVHPDADKVGKLVKDVKYSGFTGDDVSKVIDNFFATKENSVTKEYTLGHKKSGYIVLNLNNDVCALVTDSGVSGEGSAEEEKRETPAKKAAE